MEDTPERIIKVVFRIVASYLAAGLVMTVVFFAGTEGHADVPFSEFPEWLILTPVMPVWTLDHLFTGGGWSARDWAGVLLGPATFVLAWRWFGRRARP
ncbi:MAG: hypothetical protein WCC48_19265 [Anaeromyxobacteraceae bacterium]